MNKPIKITRQDFLDYEDVRVSGETNMIDTKKVERLSDLRPEIILEIMKTYTTLAKKWPDVLKEAQR